MREESQLHVPRDLMGGWEGAGWSSPQAPAINMCTLDLEYSKSRIYDGFYHNAPFYVTVLKTFRSFSQLF